MKKQYLIIIFSIMAIGLVTGIYQYVQFFQAEMVGAYNTTKPNPGHSWSEIQCTEGLCVTTDNKVGIGTDAPAQKLSVVGVIESTSGGFKFPDGTTQTTKTLAGATGPAGATGATGPQGPQGISGVSAGLACVTISCGACPDGYTVVGCGGTANMGGAAGGSSFTVSGNGCSCGAYNGVCSCSGRCCKLQ
jgi:hypothetical protein